MCQGRVNEHQREPAKQQRKISKSENIKTTDHNRLVAPSNRHLTAITHIFLCMLTIFTVAWASKSPPARAHAPLPPFFPPLSHTNNSSFGCHRRSKFNTTGLFSDKMLEFVTGPSLSLFATSNEFEICFF